MHRIYISDHGDDKSDGRTRDTAIYSWTRAIKLCDGNAEAQGESYCAVDGAGGVPA
jgi:hypothetical protein